MENLIIRKATIEDIDGISKVEELCFDDPWSRESFRQELAENQVAHYMIGEIEGQVVAYAGLWCILDEGHITNVAVLPTFRDNSIGSLVFQKLLESTREQGVNKYTLEVRPSNDRALSLYRKYGFKAAGRRPKYYQNNGEDAIIMWRG